MPHELHAASLRAAVRTVLEDPSYRAGAARLAAEVAAMPSPAGVAATLRES
jgi:UDP:flavonoid glycosyltransferase YjiC (YdhE family)